VTTRRLIAALALLAAAGCAAHRPRSAGLPPLTAPEARTEPDADPEREPEPDAALEPAPDTAQPPEDPARAALREAVLAHARRSLGKRPRLDCSGYVLAAYRAAGLVVKLGPSRTRSEALRAASRPVEAPLPGDLAFFRDTYDRDRDGRVDDGITHVALVEAVDGARVTLLHRGGRVQRMRMDLAAPADPDQNDPVRIRRRRDVPGTRYLAGQLFVAFGALLDAKFTQMLQASRADDTGRPEAPERWSRAATRGATSNPASRSTPRQESSSSEKAGCSGSCRSTRRSSSPSSASAGPGAPPSPAP
jgi:hypothetical protein